MKCRNSGENPEGFQNLQGLENKQAFATTARKNEAKGQGFRWVQMKRKKEIRCCSSQRLKTLKVFKTFRV